MPLSFSLPVPQLAKAACTAPDVKPAWWFPEPETKATTELAREVCSSCPELEACRDYAISAGPQLTGVWGATSTSQRAQLRRSLHRGATVITDAALGDVDEPSDAELAAIEAARPTDLASTNGHPGRRCSECGGPMPTSRSADAVTCSRRCADALGRRKRVEHYQKLANSRPQLEARPPVPAEAPDPLEALGPWLATMPPVVRGLTLEGGWQVTRTA